MINEKKIVVTILIFSFGNMGPPPPLDGKSDTHFPFLPNRQQLCVLICLYLIVCCPRDARAVGQKGAQRPARVSLRCKHQSGQHLLFIRCWSTIRG